MADDTRRQADLDWLYGDQRPSPDRTRILDASEQAELQRRRAAATGAQAAGQQSSDQRSSHGQQQQQRPAQPQRVVHTEDVVAAAPAPRTRPLQQDGPAQPAAPASGERIVHTEGDLSGAPQDVPWRRSGAAAAPARGTARSPRTAAAATGAAAAAGAGSSRPPAPPAGPRTAAASGPGRRRVRLPRRRWLRWLVIALVAWLVWLVLVPMIALSRSPQIKEQPTGDRPAQEPGTLTLLVGSDKRSNLTAAQQKELGTGGSDISGARTDTMMLLYRPASGKPVLISLPRDSYVKIPGHGHNKLNAAYGLGGPQLLTETVENLTGLKVDNYLEVGFDGFANVVDSLGGITMCLDKPMVDKNSHTNLPAGCQTLSGTNALGYVRMRYADPLGDLGRVKRQRAMIGAISKKAMSPMTFINPVRYWKLNMAAGQGLTRGQDTGITELPGIANAFLSVSGHADQTLTLPVANSNYSTPAGDAVQLDDAKLAKMCDAMAHGDTSNLAQYAK